MGNNVLRASVIQAKPLAVDPVSITDVGALYFNTTSLSLRYYNGTSWNSVTSGGANTSLSNLSSTSINASLIFNADLTYDIGSLTNRPLNIIGSFLTATDSIGLRDLAGTPVMNMTLISGLYGLYTGPMVRSPLDFVTYNSFGLAGRNNGGGTSHHLVMLSGNGATSGDVILRTGNATVTRGKIALQDGSEGTIGHVWTSTTVDGRGQWSVLPTSANTSLSNLISTSINQNLNPDSDNTRSIGTNTLRWANIWGDFVSATGSLGLRDAATNPVFTAAVAGPFFSLYTGPFWQAPTDFATYSAFGFRGRNNNSGNTHHLVMFTGNSTGGNSGDVVLRVGTATGTQGRITFQDGSQGIVDDVWTSNNTSGGGQWKTLTLWNTLVKAVADNGYTAATRQEIFANTSGGAFTINLPAAPVAGQRVRFVDYSGDWGTNNLTIGRNGSNIMSVAADEILNVSNSWAEFVYVDPTRGWSILL